MRTPLVRGTRILSIACALAALLLAGPSALDAQEGVTSGSVAGQITDADGQPLADAVVRVRSVERGTERQVLTGEDGRYRVPLLQPGAYTVRAEYPPLRPVERGPVTVSLGERTTLNITLQPVEAEELQVVVGGVRQIDLSQGGVVDNVDQEQIDNLPSAGRDFTDFINLSGLVSPQPQVGTGGQFSLGGARTAGTNVQIDGADANNAFFGENRGSSRIPFTFSLRSIKEFQIVTNGYDVEYGRFSGGVVNAVTRSGTNEFTGGAHFFWRDESLTTENFDQTDPVDFQSFQFGGAVGGPIIEDKLHFFASGDFQQWEQPTFALTPDRSNIPGSTIQEFQDILINQYGFDPSNVEDDFGVFDETQDEANLFGRLDWTIDPDHRLSVRANYADFENQNDRISPGGRDARTVGGTFNDESLSLVGELNSIFSPEVYNTFRVQYSAEDRPRPGNSILPSVFVPVTDREGNTATITYGGAVFGILFANNLEEDKIQLTDNLVFNLGDHTLKVGTDNVFTDTFNKFWLNGNGFFSFDSLADFRNGAPSFFLRFVPQTPPGEEPSAPIADFSTQEYSVYVQDSWQATDRLLLNLGLRWDYVNLEEGAQLADPDFRAVAQDTFGVSTATTPDDTDNFGPRASFTYDIRGDETQVVRGGAGLFYGRIPTVLHSNILSKTPRPLLSVGCFGAGIPEFNYGQWVDNPGAIPDECQMGIGFTGEPVIDVWNPETDQPTTLKANLGYEQRLGDRWNASLQAIYSRTWNNFHVVDLNLQDEQFQTADGRPVHAEVGDFDPTDDADNFQRGINTDIDRLWQNTDIGEAQAFNFKLDVQGQPLENLRVSGNYTLNLAYDNSSFSCCLETEAWESALTAGNPNVPGGVGDDETGSWGPSDFERRHVFVVNAILELPADFQASVIYRGQSGNPYTPVVDGDVNADGVDDNDRAYIPDPDSPSGVQFEDAAALDKYRSLVAEESCLRENVGQIVSRNACRNPWFHRVDLKFTKGIRTFGGQRVEIVADLFNVLDGLGLGAGEFVFKSNELFEAEGFDPATQEVIYSVEDFGREIPVGFEPFQFQAQLGVRYSF